MTSFFTVFPMRFAHPLTAAVAAIILLGVGCGGGSRGALGGGEEIDVCGGYETYDELPEPDPGDPDGLERYVDGFLRVLDRVDVESRFTDPDGDRHDVPAAVIRDLATLETSMKRLRDRIDAAEPGGNAAVRAAANAFADDTAFSQTDRRLSDFHATSCR